MIRRITELTQPGVEPVTLEEVKTHLRITTTADDTWLTFAIKAARLAAEDYTGRAFITRTFRQTTDGNPGGGQPWWDGTRQASVDVLAPREIELLKPPLVSVQSVTAYDDSDQPTVLSASTYFVDAVDPNHPGRVVLRRGQTWPVVLRVANGLVIDYTAGYGAAASNLPADLVQAVKAVVAWMYAHRGDCTCDEAGAKSCMLPCGATYLLDSFRLVRF